MTDLPATLAAAHAAVGETAFRQVGTFGPCPTHSCARQVEIMANSSEHIRSCPYCELAFVYHTEVVDHIRHDHPEHSDVVAGIEPRELPAD